MARILVADDSSIMRRNLSAILEKAGHTIVGEATNGDLAVREFERLKPDLITMDITMPVMDGIAAVKKIIELNPNANIIMISALDQKFMVLTAIQCGAKHYVIKPFTAEKVIHVVNEVLKLKGEITKPHESSISRKPSDSSGAIASINKAIKSINESISSIDDELPSLDE